MDSCLARKNDVIRNAPAEIIYFPLTCQKDSPVGTAASYAQLREVRFEDIPEEYQDIVSAIGMDAFLKFVNLCGGLNMYVPKVESLERAGRDREIRARFDGGNYKALSALFRLSERQIRKIINGTRR